MNQCASCGREVSEEFYTVPRRPCPYCGATGRSFSRSVHETLSVSDSISWSQTRPAPNGNATLNDSGEIGLKLSGRPPRNEEDSIAVSARLVRSLNCNGENWSEPVPSAADIDSISTDNTNPDKRLFMQVVRANTDEAFWQSLGRSGTAEKKHDVEAAANDLITAVRKKAQKYPAIQRKKLTLVLDASHTPNHTFRQVHDVFSQVHRGECRKFGFSSVWVVGASDALVTRLDK